MKICKTHNAIPCFCDDPEKLIILISNLENSLSASDEETQKNRIIIEKLKNKGKK